jgi:hypothetical protein
MHDLHIEMEDPTQTFSIRPVLIIHGNCTRITDICVYLSDLLLKRNLEYYVWSNAAVCSAAQPIV